MEKEMGAEVGRLATTGDAPVTGDPTAGDRGTAGNRGGRNWACHGQRKAERGRWVQWWGWLGVRRRPADDGRRWPVFGGEKQLAGEGVDVRQKQGMGMSGSSWEAERRV